MYAILLNEEPNFGWFFELSKEEVIIFDINAIDLNRDHCYALSIDFNIPDKVKIKNDDLPLSNS